MIRATIDTSVFVSALNFGGIPNEVFKRLEAGSFTLCISQSVIDEIKRVLLMSFGWTDEDLAEALDPILSFAEMVEPMIAVNGKPRPQRRPYPCLCFGRES